MRVLHIIDGFSIGGIQELIFNLYKYSAYTHHGKGYAGSLTPEMERLGFLRWDGNPVGIDYDVCVGHTVGGWKYDDTFKWAHEHGMKTVEVMHSVHPSPTEPSLVDGFIGLNNMVLEKNQHMPKRVCIYAMANNVTYINSSSREYIGRVSRVVAEKRPDVFADIAERFSGDKFLLGGDGYMLDSIRARNIQNLETVGMVRDFNAFFERLKLCVFPTKDECCCMSVAMAQSARVPVVCQDLPQLRETTGGFAIFADGVDDFCHKIQETLVTPEFTAQLALKAERWAYDNFSPKVVAGKWDNYLREILSA